MVAELTCIPIVTVQKKGRKKNNLLVSGEINNNIVKKLVKRPSWIEVATRESKSNFFLKEFSTDSLNLNLNYPDLELNSSDSESNSSSFQSNSSNSESNISNCNLNFSNFNSNYLNFERKKLIIKNHVIKDECTITSVKKKNYHQKNKKEINEPIYSVVDLSKKRRIKKMEDHSGDEPWLNPVISIPRGVINIDKQNYYRKKLLKNPNENRDIMIERENNCHDDMLSTNVDSISEFGTLSYQNNSQINYDIEHDNNWKIIKHKRDNDFDKKIEKNTEESKLNSGIDDGNILPEYSVNNEEDNKGEKHKNWKIPI